MGCRSFRLVAEWPDIVFDHAVLVPIALLVEGQAADVAGKRLLPSVNPEVNVHIAPRCNNFIAVFHQAPEDEFFFLR